MGTMPTSAELKQDLSMMVGDPCRFVDHIQISGSLPVLAICDKLYNYNREEEMAKLDGLDHQYIKENAFKGVMISGGAGFEGPVVVNTYCL